MFLTVVLLSTLAGVASADLTQSMSPITGKVFVSDVTFDPEFFFSGDEGTVTYTVMNGNANTSVMMNHGNFYDADIRLLSDTYDFSNTLAPCSHGHSPSRSEQMPMKAIITPRSR